jgi:uncharacterized protein
MQAADPPLAFHVLAKPAGASCNLACTYCFYLDKTKRYRGSSLRMSDAVLRCFLRQYLAATHGGRATVAWQGGEPTLMGLDFFRCAVRYAREYAPPGTLVRHTLQTNGTILDSAWCEFLHERGFLVGISIDGPRELHDAYRVDRAGRPTFDRVLRGARLLREHAVEFNVLAAVHSANADRPLEVYRFLRDEIGARYMQFLPIVERSDAPRGHDREFGLHGAASRLSTCSTTVAASSGSWRPGKAATSSSSVPPGPGRPPALGTPRVGRAVPAPRP